MNDLDRVVRNETRGKFGQNRNADVTLHELLDRREVPKFQHLTAGCAVIEQAQVKS